MTYERFKQLWKKVDEESHQMGELAFSDWAEMCSTMEKMAAENALPKMPSEGAVMTEPQHLAFVAGVKWGFSRCSQIRNANISRDPAGKKESQ